MFGKSTLRKLTTFPEQVVLLYVQMCSTLLCVVDYFVSEKLCSALGSRLLYFVDVLLTTFPLKRFFFYLTFQACSIFVCVVGFCASIMVSF